MPLSAPFASAFFWAVTAAQPSLEGAGRFVSNDTEGVRNISGIPRILSNYEFLLSVLAVVFGVIVLFVQYRLVVNKAAEWTAEQIIRMSMLTLIVTGALFFVAAGFDSQQIAPAIGLFGTVAGYLLGQQRGPKNGGGNEGSDS